MKDFLLPTVEEIANWPKPEETYVDEAIRPEYAARKQALESVLTGRSLTSAARDAGVNRNTLSEVCKKAIQTHADGRPYGFRACLPYVRATSQPMEAVSVESLSKEPRPHAFSKIVATVKGLGDMLRGFTGALPDDKTKSPAFRKLFERVKKALREAKLGDHYPLTAKDHGRRALLAYLKRMRAQLIESGTRAGAALDDAVLRLADLFPLQPFDSIQFDAHKTDVNWIVAVPVPSGGVVYRKISAIWFLSAIDVGSLAIIGWVLVIGRNYSQYDVLRLIAACLRPWRRKTLSIHNLHYRPDAWMPNAVDDASAILRAIQVSADNHKGHLAKLVRQALTICCRGVLHFGLPHVPQVRPDIETFHKTLEQHFLRFIAGSYIPSTELGEHAKHATHLKPADYPLDIDALEQATDVFIANYCASPNSGKQGRTPREVCEAFKTSGGWCYTSSTTQRDVEELLKVRKLVTIKGSKKALLQPHVNYEGAKYRAPALRGRFDLVGRKFWAQHPLDDARKLALHSVDDGLLYVVLEVQAPWCYSEHSIDLRKKINAWDKRGLIDLRGGADIVAAYHEHVRANAARYQYAADEFVKMSRTAPGMAHRTARPASAPPTPSEFEPREGWIRLGRRDRS